MNILKTLQRAERKLEQKVNKAARELSRLQAAITALGHKATKSAKPRKRRLSAEARAKIAAAQKRRWAKVRAKKQTK